nr:hypothetical protein Iba_chr08aCG0680 [Ipomoea batatas]
MDQGPGRGKFTIRGWKGQEVEGVEADSGSDVSERESKRIIISQDIHDQQIDGGHRGGMEDIEDDRDDDDDRGGKSQRDEEENG